jgi:hypothetical protein
MKYLKLFEAFKEVSKYVLKDLLPRRGIMEVHDKDQLLTLILIFEEKGYREGYQHDTTRTWLEKDWNDLRVDFQWEVDSVEGPDKRIYVDSLDNMEFTDNELLDFNDYFEFKPEFRGHKLKKFGV